MERFDPIELTERVRGIACKGEERKYYRFRPARFYGGIASADCVGCNLRCIYCWSNDPAREGRIGEMMRGEEVAGRLVEIARRFGFRKARITGNEPTLCGEHLINVLSHLPGDILFILETNGILLGFDEDLVSELSAFKNLHVRVSLKGCDGETFSALTGAIPESLELQLKALENCVRQGISCHAALPYELADPDEVSGLIERLRRISPGLERVELEPITPYPHVRERLERAMPSLPPGIRSRVQRILRGR